MRAKQAMKEYTPSRRTLLLKSLRFNLQKYSLTEKLLKYRIERGEPDLVDANCLGFVDAVPADLSPVDYLTHGRVLAHIDLDDAIGITQCDILAIPFLIGLAPLLDPLKDISQGFEETILPAHPCDLRRARTAPRSRRRPEQGSRNENREIPPNSDDDGEFRTVLTLRKISIGPSPSCPSVNFRPIRPSR